MKHIPLTTGGVALVSDRDYAYLMRWQWRRNTGRGNYAVRDAPRPNRALIFMHKVVAARKQPPIVGQVDHRNQNKLDNQRSNLRAATSSQNKANEGLRSTNKSGYRGVCWDRRDKTWRACIVVNCRQISLGYYQDKKVAAKAYNQAARKYFGVFAYQNPI